MENSIGKKLLLGALIGWGVAFLLMALLLGGANDFDDIKVMLFFALAPGAISGIIVTYIINKNKKNDEY